MFQTDKYSKIFKEPALDLDFFLEQELEWFEEETLEYLIFFFLKGNFIFINEILEKSKIQIDNIDIQSKNEMIQLTFLKFISQKVSIFKNFLSNWSRKLVIQSIENPITLNNQIEGKILWKETFRARNYLNYPDSVKFVCSSYKNNYDSLENLIIKSFLTFLKKLIEGYLKYLRFCYKDRYPTQDWRYHAISIYNLLNQILNNYYLREISLNPHIWKNIILLSKALHSCSKNNLTILFYAYLLNDLNSPNKKDLLKKFLLNYILKPNTDKTAELYVLFTIIEKISQFEKGTDKFFIIKPKSETPKNQPLYIKNVDQDRQIKVYYQRKPEWLSIKYPEELLFTKILRDNNLQIVELLPDIIIEIINAGFKKVILIEVKNSSDSQYLRQGLFQLCNYYEYLKMNENSNWIIFPSKSSEFKKEGILISKEIPVGWKMDVDRIWNKKKTNIKILDFDYLKHIDSDIFVSNLFS